MDRQPELQTKLENILKKKNVYYNPPSTLRMNYPAIRYKVSDIVVRSADNISYIKMKQYQLTYISYRADESIVDQLMELPGASFVREYTTDGLYHNVMTIFW